jgi:pimeloyl-ACP methyl ester carboxylesterase
MMAIRTKAGTWIHCKDWGSGQPLVFFHGWLSSRLEVDRVASR